MYIKRQILAIKIFLLLVSMFLLLSQTQAQLSQTIRVKAGEDLSKAVSEYGIYRFPEFITGVFFLKNGAYSSIRLNYNFLLESMQYINSKGDTLSITNSKDISFISISDTIFYYNNGYMEQFADYDSIKLAIHQSLKIGFEKNGAYDMASPAAAIDNISQFDSYIDSHSYNRTVRFELNKDAILEKQIGFFILYKSNLPVKATKENVLKLFPQKKKEIVDYIKHQNIKFQSKKELEELFSFCMKIN